MCSRHTGSVFRTCILHSLHMSEKAGEVLIDGCEHSFLTPVVMIWDMVEST